MCWHRRDALLDMQTAEARLNAAFRQLLQDSCLAMVANEQRYSWRKGCQEARSQMCIIKARPVRHPGSPRRLMTRSQAIARS